MHFFFWAVGVAGVVGVGLACAGVTPVPMREATAKSDPVRRFPLSCPATSGANRTLMLQVVPKVVLPGSVGGQSLVCVNPDGTVMAGDMGSGPLAQSPDPGLAGSSKQRTLSTKVNGEAVVPTCWAPKSWLVGVMDG